MMKFTINNKDISLTTGNCIQILPDMPANSVDIVVTSPPYNFDIKYNSYKDLKDSVDYLRDMYNFSSALRHVLQPSGSIFLNIGAKPSNNWWPRDVLAQFRGHFTLQNVFHWVKSIAIMRESSKSLKEDVLVGHYKPINSSRYVNDCHEYIFHLTKSGSVPIARKAIGVPYSDKSNISRWGGSSEDRRCRGNTWFIPYATVRGKKSHPAAFPVALPDMCIRLHGVHEDSVVLDPFMGSGSSAIAAIGNNANFIGIDIDPLYTTQAYDRIITFGGSQNNSRPLP